MHTVTPVRIPTNPTNPTNPNNPNNPASNSMNNLRKLNIRSVTENPFANLRLTKKMQTAATKQLKYGAPTSIQQSAIPLIADGQDVRIHSPTGSGKTAAYVLPLVQRLTKAETPTARCARCLVLVPTRELAEQVSDVFQEVSDAVRGDLTIRKVYGGVSMSPQLKTLQYGVDVLVATPGRLIDVIANNGTDISSTEHLIIDEADRLLSGEFLEQVTKLLKLLGSEERQTIASSATYSKTIVNRVSGLFRKGKFVRVGKSVADTDDIDAAAGAADGITYRAIKVSSPKRRIALLSEITTRFENSLVFVAQKKEIDSVAECLRNSGISATTVHSDLTQSVRQQRLDDFKAGGVRVLVATDVAARGIDIDRLQVVVNYDLPRSPLDFRHRCGRTGRAGATGTAISFITADTEAHLELIEKKEKLKIPREVVEGFRVDEVQWRRRRAELKETQRELSNDNMMGGIKSTTKKSKKDKLREQGKKP